MSADLYQAAAVLVALLAVTMTHYGLVRATSARTIEALVQLRRDHEHLAHKVEAHLSEPQHGVSPLVSRDMCTQMHGSQALLWAERFDHLEQKMDVHYNATETRLTRLEQLVRNGSCQ